MVIASPLRVAHCTALHRTAPHRTAPHRTSEKSFSLPANPAFLSEFVFSRPPSPRGLSGPPSPARTPAMTAGSMLSTSTFGARFLTSALRMSSLDISASHFAIATVRSCLVQMIQSCSAYAKNGAAANSLWRNQMMTSMQPLGLFVKSLSQKAATSPA